MNQALTIFSFLIFALLFGYSSLELLAPRQFLVTEFSDTFLFRVYAGCGVSIVLFTNWLFFKRSMLHIFIIYVGSFYLLSWVMPVKTLSELGIYLNVSTLVIAHLVLLVITQITKARKNNSEEVLDDF